MRIVRYAKGETVGYGCQREDGSTVAIDGDPVAGMAVTGAAGRSRGGIAPCSVSRRVIGGAQLLAPVVPACILCIGLNYRRHLIMSTPSLDSRKYWPRRTVSHADSAGTSL